MLFYVFIFFMTPMRFFNLKNRLLINRLKLNNSSKTSDTIKGKLFVVRVWRLIT